MDKKKLKVEYWDVDKITPYENNPRDNDSAVFAIKASIQEFGFVNPIIVDSEKVIIAGHARLKAAYELGIKKVPVVIADHLTAQQAKAYRIIDNSTVAIADWNMELLSLEVDELPDIDFEFYGLDVDFDDLLDSEEYVPPENKEDTEEKTTNPCNECPNCGYQW